MASKLSATLKNINMHQPTLDKKDVDCPKFVSCRIYANFEDTIQVAEIVSMLSTISEEDGDVDCYTIYKGLISKRNRFKKTNFSTRKKMSSEVLEYCKKHNISEEKYNEIKHLINIGEDND